MADTFGFLAAFIWIWCSPVIVFLLPTWISLAALTGKPVFIGTSLGCEREREALGVGLLAAPESCAVLCSAMLRWGPLLPSEHHGVWVGWRAARGWFLLWGLISWLWFQFCYLSL